MVLYETVRTGVINDITDAATLKRVRGLPVEYLEIKKAPEAPAPPADTGGQDPGGHAQETKKQGK